MERTTCIALIISALEESKIKFTKEEETLKINGLNTKYTIRFLKQYTEIIEKTKTKQNKTKLNYKTLCVLPTNAFLMIADENTSIMIYPKDFIKRLNQ